MGEISNIDIGWRSALMFAVCLPLLVAAAMLFLRPVERSANAFLAAFLLIAAIAQIPQIIGFAGFYTVWPGLTFAPFSVELYAGPLLYLHADRLMRASPPRHGLWLLLPGAIQTSYYLWAFVWFPDYRAKWAYSDSFHVPYVEPVETAIGLGLMAWAIVIVYRMIKRYRFFLGQTQSAARDFNPTWLSRLMIAILLAGLVFVFLEFVPVFIVRLSYVDEFPAQVLLTAIVAWLGFQAIAQTGVKFPKMPVQFQEEATNSEKGGTKDWIKEGKALRQAVTEHQWFLEPRLTIGDLAGRMHTNESYLSRTLNQGLEMNFNRFINLLRIDHAKEMMLQGNLNLLEISEASGFNSKATFNRVFRDLTGATPSQFKKSQNQ